MSDARWDDVWDATASCSRHFTGAAAIFDGLALAAENASYMELMALLHAMQSGHTSFETALLRTFAILGEEPPTGSGWHATLIDRSARPIEDRRPALISSEMAEWAHDTRRFRHLAMHAYDFTFRPEKGRAAIMAGTKLAEILRPSLAAAAAVLDR